MTGKPGSFSGRLFGQTSDSRIGFWLRRLLALIAGNLVVHFLPVSVIFWGARPRRQILRRTARPCRYVVRHMAGTRCESGRDNQQCNQASHDRTDSRWRDHEHAPVRRFSWRPVPKTPREALDIRGEHGIVGSVALAALIFLFLPLHRRAGRVLHLEPFA